jgi:hypothetical protein
MKKILILPGNGSNNAAWLEKTSGFLKNDFEIIAHSYNHWSSGEQFIDLQKEVDGLAGINPEYVFAKSAGIMVTLLAIQQKVVAPKICMFVGLPKTWADEHRYDIDSLLKGHKIPTLFIQQENDPIFSFVQLTEYLQDMEISDAAVYSVQGDDHIYDNFEDLKKKFFDFKAAILGK